MEFPHLGQHCNEPTCKQLDFLPMKCDACAKIFCRDHIIYSSHHCTESYKKDNQIPVCPLCNLPCPLKKGELPDLVVGRHIESDCQSDPAKERRKVYTNKCSKKGCKQKELIQVKCESCHLNYCLRHRHEQDHNCQGFQNSGRAVSNSAAAAIFRSQQASSSTANKNRNSNNVRPNARVSNPASFQGTMSEDEALARALQQSMGAAAAGTTTSSHTDGMTQQEREDFLLAQALSMSEQEPSLPQAQHTGQDEKKTDKCAVQ